MDVFPIISVPDGSFHLCEEHVREYNRRTGGDLTTHWCKNCGEHLRYDPVLAAVVEELRDTVDSTMRVKWYPMRYRDYVTIDADCCSETVHVNVNLCLLREIAQVLASPGIDDAERCRRISELAQQRREDRDQ